MRTSDHIGLFTGKLVKISRYAQAFWVRDVRQLEPGIWVGVVDNNLGLGSPFQLGDPIPFASCEVTEAMEYPKPTLTIVAG